MLVSCCCSLSISLPCVKFLDGYFLKVIVGITWVLAGIDLSCHGPHDSEWGIGEQGLPIEQAPWVANFEMLFHSVHISPVTPMLSTRKQKSASYSNSVVNSESNPLRSRKHCKWGTRLGKVGQARGVQSYPDIFPPKRPLSRKQSHRDISGGLGKASFYCWSYIDSMASLTS